ncbi:MAG: DUF5717 family protein [Butyrivibrio sp.]|nr:DUF5717 family protein [Butyrivibrio sp.]
MNKIVEQLMRGQFQYEDRNLNFSVPRLELTLSSGENAEGFFTIYGPTGLRTEGTVFSTELRMEVLTNSFSGSQYDVAYRFDSTGLAGGEVIKGDFRIISNQGEYLLPFVVNIAITHISSSFGDIRNLFHFANLAKTNWDEAVKLFYSQEFINIFSGNDSQYESLYRGLAVNDGAEQSVEEFLLAINKKTIIDFIPDQSQIHLEVPSSEASDHILTISRNGWGYTNLDVEIDGDFISAEKDRIGDSDFLGNSCYFHFQINKEKLHDGNNYGSIIFKNIYTSVRVPITVAPDYNMERPSAVYQEQKQIIVRMMKVYESFRCKKINSKAWLSETGKLISRLNAIDDTNIVYKLYNAQYLITADRINEAKWILDQVQPIVESDSEGSDTLYCYYLYLTTLCSREELYINDIASKMEYIYDKNPQDWRIAWLLLYVSDSYSSNMPKKWLILQTQFEYGNNSPVIYLEALQLLVKSPTLLSRLDSFELSVIEYGFKKKLLSQSLIEQLVYLASREKKYNKRLFKILKLCYEAKASDLTLEAICLLLIKGNITDREAFDWYAKGVERELRITRLYEYYMMSIYVDEDGNLPCDISRMVLMYFSYQSDLDYDKNAILYRYIYENRDKYPELYETYRPQIERFIMSQLDKGRINADLGYLYTNLLTRQMVDTSNCYKVLQILYTNEICVESPLASRVVVVYDKCEKEIDYPLSNGRAFVPLYGTDYSILIADRYGNRYCKGIEYDVNKLMLPGKLAAYTTPYIQKGKESLDLFLCELGRNAYSITMENVSRYRELATSDMVRASYRNEIRNNLIRFYYDNDFIRQLTEYINDIDPQTLTDTERNEMIELMVMTGIYDRALDWLKRFGTHGVEPKIIVRLYGRLMDRELLRPDYEEVTIAYYAFSKGKYDEQLLRFLVDNFEGTAKEMRDLWRAAGSFGIDTYALDEKMILRMLYTGSYVGERVDIFKEYVKNGAKVDVEMAFLAQSAYDSFVKNTVTGDYIFERIGTAAANNNPMLLVCKMAYLRYYAENTGSSEPDENVIAQFLKDLTSKNLYFPFYHEYIDVLPRMQEYADKTMLEYRTTPGSKCVLHYAMDTDEDDNSTYNSIEMPEMYDGIYVASFVLFFGEKMQYYITETGKDDDNDKLTESGTISNSDIMQNSSSGRYSIINDIMIGKTLQDYETVDKLLEEYYKNRFLSSMLFKPLK